MTQKQRKKEPNGDRLAISGDWKTAVATSLKKPMPTDGFPARAVKPRAKRKKAK